MYKNILGTRPHEECLYVPLETHLKSLQSVRNVTVKPEVSSESTHALNKVNSRFYHNEVYFEYAWVYGKQYFCWLSGYDFEVYRYRGGSDSDDSEEG
jgi:hypothetical protein